MELLELVELKKELEYEIIERTTVVKSGVRVKNGYLNSLTKLQIQKNEVVKKIHNVYDMLNKGVSSGYEYYEDIEKRYHDAASVDDDGQPILEVAQTNVTPIDEYFFSESNGGIPFATYMGVVGESNSGKSDIVYMLVKGFIENRHKVHLHSYELGKYAIYKTLSSDFKNKLRGITDNPDNHEMLSVDTEAYDLEDLEEVAYIRFLDGCRIFIIDSITKITINGRKPDDIEEVSERLRRLAHENSLIVIVIGQKSKQDILNDTYAIYGSIQVQHHLDVMLFIELENKYNRTASERILWMEKNRGESKYGIITDYDDENFTLKYARESDGNKKHNPNYAKNKGLTAKETEDILLNNKSWLAG